VTLKVYTHPQSVFKQHSFLVGNEQGGLSEQIGVLPIEKELTTVKDMRQMIEEQVDRNMVRRTAMFIEFLTIATNLPNPYKYSDRKRKRYRFGVFPDGDTTKIPKLIPEEVEDDLLVLEAVSDPLHRDLLLIPQSQISSDGELVPAEDPLLQGTLVKQITHAPASASREIPREGGAEADAAVGQEGVVPSNETDAEANHHDRYPSLAPEHESDPHGSAASGDVQHDLDRPTLVLPPVV